MSRSELEKNLARNDLLHAINEKLCGEEGEKWDAAFRRCLRGENPWPVEAPVERFLSDGTKVFCPARVDPFDPDHDYRPRSGIYVSEEFRNLVLTAAKKIDRVPAMEISSYDLVRPANDAEIEGELPIGYVFEDVSEGCAIIGGLIDRQANGETGPLLTNGRTNIFYLRVLDRVLAVDVAWFGYGRGWDVCVYPLDGDRWNAGDRAFCLLGA